jgi:sec-independent protein translocase protein TatC
MTLMQHLYELRHRLFLAVLAIFLGAVIGFIWFSVGVPALHIRALGDILTEPYCAVPSPPRVEFAGVDKCQLLATGPFSTLQLRLTAAIMAGFVLTCPFWLYQLWAYVGPALYSKEKRFALAFTGIGAVLFAGGMVLAYLIIPEALKVLLGFGGDFVQAALDPQLYYKFLIGMMLIFGVSLELPLLLVMLNFAGVVKGVKLAKARRYACFGLIVFSGIAVPGNDPISMSVLAATLCVLYEVAVQVSKAHDRRKAKVAAASFAELPDELASPLAAIDEVPGGAVDFDVAPIDTPEPVAPASPVAPSAEADLAAPADSDTGDEAAPGAANWTDVT